MLVECGFVRAVAGDGEEYTFTPSLGRIAALGSPREIVRVFAALHGPDAETEAAYVLACLCDQEDPAPLIGWPEPAADASGPIRWHDGAMPPSERVIIARHLMTHGVAGKAKPGKPEQGAYSEEFRASEYIAAARVHLGLSSADAEAISMTEFQQMLEMKFPEVDKARDLPTREEYHATKARILERRRNG